ncbi:MAG TPA: cytochrome (ubi)quinol oxidase subunit III [Bacillota bacterium]|nr:cytochrome (ubi)quinol oxidase subunit III [Bacillota bacterium]
MKSEMAILPPNPEKATLEGKNKVLGFWLFLGGEMVLFGSLFATFIALRHGTAGGPKAQELFSLPMVALATFILLTSSLTSVLAILGMHRQNVGVLRGWLWITVLLGVAFLGLEVYEFTEYVNEGHTISSSAFGSAFYTLVGFHGGHVLAGVTWITLLIAQSYKKGLTVITAPKFYLASLYWHFVDLVWVFIFTVVYLIGKVGT